jgi:hypothetical protein
MTRPHGLVGKAYRLTVAILVVVLGLFLMAVTVFGPFWAVVVFIGAPMGLGLCGSSFGFATRSRIRAADSRTHDRNNPPWRLPRSAPHDAG